MGPSGSGKTLLMRAIADLDPSAGEVSFNGQNKNQVPAPDWRRRIAYVAAEPGWWADSAAEHFRDWAQAAPLATALLLPNDIERAPITRLSTGERQRLALIRALVENPDVLLLDEPTGPLDAAATEAVESILRERLASGISILLATHDISQADRLAKRILRLSHDGVPLEAA